MRLRSYQSRIVADAVELLLAPVCARPPLIAMATGTGKTAVAWSIIEQILAVRPRARILVLAHNQKIIRANFSDGGSLPFFEIKSMADIGPSLDHRLVITLPATIGPMGEALGRFQFMITDEAHEHWRAERVQAIISATGRPRQLLLTASHGRFPPELFHKFHYAVVDGWRDGVLDAAEISLIETSWNLSEGAYSPSGELLNPEGSAPDMEGALQKMVRILQTRAKGRVPPKTLMIAASRVMAERLGNFFGRAGFKESLIVSTSAPSGALSDGIELDADSSEFLAFRTSQKRILITVRRGNLGFDCPDLELLFDMSGSKNIERLRQLLGRLLRKSPEPLHKEFFKIMPAHMCGETRLIMACVAALCHRENDMLWRGEIAEIPLFYRKGGRSPETEEKEALLTEGMVEGPQLISDTETLGAPPEATDPSANLSELVLDFSEYAAVFDEARGGHVSHFFRRYGVTDMRRIRERGEKLLPEKVEIKRRLLEWSGKRAPSENASSPLERELAFHLSGILDENATDFDLAFARKLRMFKPAWFKGK